MKTRYVEPIAVALRPTPGGGMPTALSRLETLECAKFRINVLFTEMEATGVALRRAVELACDLKAETQMIVPHVVPYPLPLETPTVPIEFTCTKLRLLAGSVGADPYIHVYLCRDVMDLLSRILPAESIVVLAAKTGWLCGRRAKKIARLLRNNGCDVILSRTM
jgi:hypothetical protein